MTRTQAPAAAARKRAALAAFVPVVVAMAALAAFLGGLRSGERSGAAAARERHEEAPAPAGASRAAPWSARAPGAARVPAPVRAPEPGEAAPRAAAPTTPLLTPEGRPTPALVARVTAEARRALESARAGFAERCAPQGRGASATFTFNVTFDARGREIARGISEDRRLRAPEVASCLRSLPIGALRVAAPGANVGVRVAMNLP